MAININPNRINTPSSGAGKNTGRRTQPDIHSDESPVITPRRADINDIPSPESLATMVRSAVAALRKGTFWDRGTIVNLVV